MNQLVVANIEVRQDAEGRHCLNDLHKAAGGQKKDGPSYFFTNQSTKELVGELQTTGNPVVFAEGRRGGTYVCKELVYAYAMWISPKFHLQVIRAYDKLVTEGPAAAQEMAPPRRSEVFKEFVETSRYALALAKTFGFEGNQALLSADKATRRFTGMSPLEYLGTDLIAESKSKLLTPTEIGRQVGLSAHKVNKCLEELGLQKRYITTQGVYAWSFTEDGEKYGELLDTGKAFSNGTPIQQIKWLEDVVLMIEEHTASKKKVA